MGTRYEMMDKCGQKKLRLESCMNKKAEEEKKITEQNKTEQIESSALKMKTAYVHPLYNLCTYVCE